MSILYISIGRKKRIEEIRNKCRLIVRAWAEPCFPKVRVGIVELRHNVATYQPEKL